MKGRFLLALLFLVVGGPALIGCGQGVPAATQNPTPAASAPSSVSALASSSQGQKIKFTMQGFAPATQFPSQVDQWFANQVKAKTNGQVEIEVYPLSGLGFKPGEIVNAVSAGTMKISELWGSYAAGEMPVLMTAEMPGLVPFDVQYRLQTADALRPHYQAALSPKNIVLLASAQVDPRSIYTRAPVRGEGGSPLKGLKIRSSGPVDNAIIQALGGVPTPLDFSEVSSALDRGLVDGFINTHTGTLSGKLHEKAGNAYDLSVGGAVWNLVMNKDALGALPADVQATISQLGREAEYRLSIAMISQYLIARTALEQAGVKFVTPSAEAQAALMNGTRSYIENWASDCGPQCKAALQAIPKLSQ